MKIKDITQYLETIAPLAYQENYDNAGLIVGNPNAECTKALICLDSTEAVVEEALSLGCNLIIAHHPIVFSGLKKFNGKNYIERTVIKAIKNDIAIYAAHTNLDNVRQGVNGKIAHKLGLEDCEILSPKKTTDNQEIGAGMIGNLSAAVPEQDFLKLLKNNMQTPCVRHTKLREKQVKRVAVCGGAGSFLLNTAIAKGADVFVTADYKYHQFFDAEGKIVIADIGHYESEQFTMELFQEFLQKKFSNFAVVLTKTNTNPVKYFF